MSRLAVADPRPRPKTVVVMPALNAAKTLPVTVGAIPRAFVDEIILVDDHSTDETLKIARELDVDVIGTLTTSAMEAIRRPVISRRCSGTLRS